MVQQPLLFLLCKLPQQGHRQHNDTDDQEDAQHPDEQDGQRGLPRK